MRAARRLAHGAFLGMLECLANCCSAHDRVSDIERWTQSEKQDYGLQDFFDRVKTEPYMDFEPE